MIAYFPTALPDETFHSLIARYHLHTFSKNLRYSPFSFLRRGIGFIPTQLPTNLTKFTKETSHLIDLDEDQILNHHTAWPFVKKLLTGKNRAKIEALMKVDVVIPPFLDRLFCLPRIPKYCPVCNSENLDKFGEIYWSRNHQLPGINICVKHNCFLESYFQNNTKRPILFIPDSTTCRIKKPRHNKVEIITRMAAFIHEILMNDEITFNLDYSKLSEVHGYNCFKFRHKVLLRDLKKFFGKSLTEIYMPYPIENLEEQLNSNQSIHDPVVQILLQYFFKNHQMKMSLKEEFNIFIEKTQRFYTDEEKNRTKIDKLFSSAWFNKPPFAKLSKYPYC